VVSVNKTNRQLGIFYPHTPCAMLRQMSLRSSLRPVSRSFPSRTQVTKRAFHHTHSSKHHHNPRSSSHKCCRCIPIQTSSALLQIGPSFPSKRYPTSYVPSSSHTFHSSRRVQGLPAVGFIGLFSALKVRPQLRMNCAGVNLPVFFSPPRIPLLSLLQCLSLSAQLVVLLSHSFLLSWLKIMRHANFSRGSKWSRKNRETPLSHAL
jgi:hypothetical protein